MLAVHQPSGAALGWVATGLAVLTFYQVLRLAQPSREAAETALISAYPKIICK